MVRSVLGFVVGAIMWTVAFFTLARLLFLVWPDYALHAQAWMSAQTYQFTAPQSGFNALFWVLAEIFAGWLTVVIAQRRMPAQILAVVIGLYLAYMHLYYVWANFPWWYNFAVALPAIPAVLLGAKLAGGFVRAQRTVALG